MTGLSDSFQRPIDYLRISVTDRCNLRCIYCMPAEGIDLLRHDDILSYEEIYRVAATAAELGIKKIRITGGEPLVRIGLSRLVQMLAQIDTIDDIALTTNGTLLARYAEELKAAGLRRVNISLDTLKADKFKQITRGGDLADVLASIGAAGVAGLKPIKINMVVMAGINDDEVLDFARKTVADGWHVRFIEHMPLNREMAATSFISVNELKERLAVLGELEPCTFKGNGPAKYYRLPRAEGTIGFITPISDHFCFRCNRLRLTADGKLRPCLLSEQEIDLRQPLRQGVSAEELKKLIKKAVDSKPRKHKLAEGLVPRDRPFSQVGG
ncbi:MAG: GTP 3',8-cyclase MoaA [Chloroflexi bacterium]|nr:GTP 3',8-cyclase MoaA [Chloroflexota bacterium]